MGLQFWIKLHIRLNLSTNTVSAVQMSWPHQKSDYVMSKGPIWFLLFGPHGQKQYGWSDLESAAQRGGFSEKTRSPEAQVDHVIQHKP